MKHSGGYDYAGGYIYSDKIERFDAETETWEEYGNMFEMRNNMAVGLVDIEQFQDFCQQNRP